MRTRTPSCSSVASKIGLIVPTVEQRARRGQRRRQIRLGLDHHAIRQQRAGDRADFMPGGEARLGALILLGQIPAMDRQP